MQQQRTQKLFQQLWHGADYNYEQWLEWPDILSEDFRLMRLAHCNVMSVGIFSWAMLEPEEGRYAFAWLDDLMDRLVDNGIMAALATPSAAPPAWLSHQYPETRRVNAEGKREPHRRRQNFCYTSPVYREKIVHLNGLLAERYGKHPALLLWHVSNEYGASQCHCELCYTAFRQWLKARYGDLEALNRAWWTTFWSHRYTAWEHIEPIDASIQGLMLDWQRFTSDQALDFFVTEAAPLRKITPDVPITTNFMKPDVRLDYWRFAEQVDVISWDSYPRWHQTDDVDTAMQTAFYHDLHRSYKGGQPFLLMESTPSVTNWQGVSRLKKPGVHLLTSMQAIAHGANSVQYFQWRQSRGGEEKFHGAVVSSLGSEETRVFRDVAEVGQLLEDLTDVSQSSIHAPIAILYDYQNEWAINRAQLPRSLNKHYQETCQQHYSPFWKRGYAVDFIHEESKLDGYRIVIAPMMYMMRVGLAERIETFVKEGGIFVTTYLSGLVDESDLLFLKGYPNELRRTLGLYSEEMDTLADHQSGTILPCAENLLELNGSYTFHHYAELVHTEGAEVLATYHSEFYAGYPALTVHPYGKGHVYFVAARTDDRFLDDAYSGILRKAGIESPIPFELPEGISGHVREGEWCRYIFLMNFREQEQQIETGNRFADAHTGQPCTGTVTLAPYGMLILMEESVTCAVK